MNLQLIKGSFKSSEAIEILSRLIHAKIKFHESKIENSQNEEDIKMRENRIKQLQQEFYETKQAILTKQQTCELESAITIR